ncbi:MAG TPA: UbiA-like polyprenyltransferase [Gemmataceae bacterium]|nr:UbiA-like polyprenyltransferase [Gemmataceae bacterium]
MFRQIRSFLDLIRFSHTLFALPFALTGAVLAWKRAGFQWVQLVGILLCMVFARSAAMAFNRLADRRIDAANPRTAGRHLPAGRLGPTAVWLFAAVCAVGFIASTLLFLAASPPNHWPFYLSVPVLIFLCAYSLTKRFTALSHFWLGAALMLAPIAAWIAVLGDAAWPTLFIPLLLGGAVLFWVAGFDILYACQDVEFDRRARLHSVPAAIGVRASLRLAAACHAVMLALLAALFFVDSSDLGWIYLVGLAAVTVLLVYEHWIVRPEDLSRVNQAFFQVNGVISVGLFVVVLVQVAVGV